MTKHGRKIFWNQLGCRGSINQQYGYGDESREKSRLQDQASTLVEFLHADTVYPYGRVGALGDTR